MLVRLPNAYDNSSWVSNQDWSENTAIQFILKIFLFSVWVPIFEERKTNPRNPYLKMLVRIAESLYYGGSTPILGSASAYVRSGSVSYSANGSESTKSPIINLN
jgi:hypothetical protein